MSGFPEHSAGQAINVSSLAVAKSQCYLRHGEGGGVCSSGCSGLHLQLSSY